MSSNCCNDCTDSFIFPKIISNTPGLSHIDYRIGSYSDFSKALSKKLNADPNFQTWTYRGSDDPGIALLECVSILGDILTFYQELYANESFLRTAQWRESIADLVKLLGYRLAPGVGGHATFVALVKGNKNVVIPKSTQIKAQLDGFPQQTVFETDEETTAYPQLSKFNLYSPLVPPASISSDTEFYTSSGYQLKKGDRLMVGQAPSNTNQANPDRLKFAQIVFVDEVRKSPGQQLLFKIKGSLENFNPNMPFLGFKLGRSFSHFGHNAPRTIVNVNGTGTENHISYIRYVSYETDYNATPFYDENSTTTVVRIIDPTPLDKCDYPLDVQVNDITIGSRVLIQGEFLGDEFKYTGIKDKIVFARTINNIKSSSMTWGSVSGSTSIIKIDELGNPSSDTDIQTTDYDSIDIRNIQFHEVTSPMLTINVNGIDSDQTYGNQLYFYGKQSDAEVLLNLKLLLVPQEGDKPLLQQSGQIPTWIKNIAGLWSTGVASDSEFVNAIKYLVQHGMVKISQTPLLSQQSGLIPPWIKNIAGMWSNGVVNDNDFVNALQYIIQQGIVNIPQILEIPQKLQPIVATVIKVDPTNFPLLFAITLDQDVNYSDFSNLTTPTTTVYGNLIAATQGKTETETILGNGDNRQKFQTFKIPKSPLTYLLESDESPPQVPQLEIYVNGRLWKRVVSFFDRGPNELIYVVREDTNGDSWVQFGDGNTGACLPSGVDNVTAVWRSGIGAFGPLKQGTTIQPGGRIDGLDKIQLFTEASGGSQPETGENAKQSAPGKIQSLDRIVSLEDFESETLSIPGITKVLARWDLVGSVPGVILTVLMEAGREADFQTVRETISSYNNCRGSHRFPISVTQGLFQDIYLKITYGWDPTFRQEDVDKAIREALGVTGDEGNGIDGSSGLFGLAKRQFGQSEYSTRIEGVIQEVAGVIWVEINEFYSLEGQGSSPTSNTTVVCDSNSILRLPSANLQPNPTSVQTSGAC